jgi:hypothetical protein
MLASKRVHFPWGRQDRAPEPTFFRVLRQRWRPVSASLADEHSGRAARVSAIKRPVASKPAWTPWLWVGQ